MNLSMDMEPSSCHYSCQYGYAQTHVSGVQEHNSPTASQSNGRPGQPRAVLSKEQAIQIYLYRKASSASLDPYLLGNAAAVATIFRISPKTVRDIWNRRTWTEETQHLWTEGEQPVLRSKRRMMKYSVDSSTPMSCDQQSEGSPFPRSSSECSSSCSSPKVRSEDQDKKSDKRSPLESCGELEQQQSEKRSRVECSEWLWECGQPPLGDGMDDPFTESRLMRQD
eukprot:CAMPEP_0113664654 /NCGR_PEP_ID=MMETSP0038_2-20120614/1859_1 /TAXON_ID=2898 /ORGANISM="Cryptomonas paramecium" /LENGTH=223 /DNA_ID=CAMNT_0000579899 /DNA_START=11 /DNA_END=682 /DNA_ORIENTATION=+ /assembly_acc=CAM_ASM_000170